MENTLLPVRVTHLPQKTGNRPQTLFYQEYPIQFELIDDQMYCNATTMFKIGNARLDHWKDSVITKEYMEAITRNSGISENQLVITMPGSPQSGGGTWIHERLIVNAARYISQDFAAWCDTKVAQLLRTGKVELKPTQYKIPTTFSGALYLAAQQQETIELQEQRLLEARETIALQAPKAEYAEKVLLAENCQTTTTIAKDLGMSAIALNQKLKELGVQYQTREGHWVLYAKYQDLGYTDQRKHPYFGRNGEPLCRINTVWTERGREFIHRLLNKSLTTAIMGLIESPTETY